MNGSFFIHFLAAKDPHVLADRERKASNVWTVQTELAVLQTEAALGGENHSSCPLRGNSLFIELELRFVS